jgi:hypothetical protein
MECKGVAGMTRFLFVALVVVLGVQIPRGAHASTYDMTLTPTVGSIGGAGSFDVVAPLSGSGISQITDFSVTIDQETFTLGNEISAATATFSSGMLTGLDYVGALLGGGFNLDILDTGGLTYTFLDIGTGAALASGIISAIDPPLPSTPLPTTILMFATGLLGLALLTYRRKTHGFWKVARGCASLETTNDTLD